MSNAEEPVITSVEAVKRPEGANRLVAPRLRAIVTGVLMAAAPALAGCSKTKSNEELQAQRVQQREAFKKEAEDRKDQRARSERLDIEAKAAKIPELLQRMKNAKPDSIEYIQALTEAQAAVKEIKEWNKKFPTHAVPIPGEEKK